MNFSDLFKQSDSLCQFSPNGRYLANAVQYRLVIRDVKTLQIHQLFTCLDAIQYIEWSPDSDFVLCGMFKRALIQVWSLDEPDWTCKIDEGSAGLTGVHWSPDSRHVLSTAEFNIRITVWSLVDKTVSYIKHPKACQKGYDFSDDGKMLVLAERRDGKDFLSVFACNNWQLIKHFQTATDDLCGVQCSPDSRVICVWESCLQYNVLLYSLDGRCLSSFAAYEFALGVKSLAWSPTSQFLAIGSYDQKVRVLNHITWKTVAQLDHPATLDGNSVVIYKEVPKKLVIPSEEVFPPPPRHSASATIYEVVSGTAQVPVVAPDSSKANPKMGVGLIAFSQDSKYFFSRNDNMPCALWVWGVQKRKLVVLLIQDAPIQCVEWDSSQPRLALCTGNNKVFMWSPAGCLSVQVPSEASFSVNSIRWHKDGNALLLIGRDKMCLCFLSATEELGES